ncbi:hypothetical protein JVU11DRAFT_12682 [Chiua virens]|nr:hypothetical protein JVU11DRAFT_12682 [Chiua virens]
MATATPEIQVSAMFRADPESAAWRWIHCLTFSVETLSQLHFPRPYQWIKYAIGVVVGAYGELSSSVDSYQDVIDRNDLPSETIHLYYHLTDEERQGMFPIDLDMGSPTVASSSFSTRRLEFRDKVVERDRVCVLTGAGLHMCEAAHLVSHAKGDDYIASYTQHRSRVENDVVEEVDDVRNGILINSSAHKGFGKYTAFLMTPNFAMTTADIHPDLPPGEQCCTAHRFVPGPAHDSDFGGILHPGCRVQMPPSGSDDRSNWPPDILFDAVYANAVLLHFAAPGLQDVVRQWKSTFYPGGVTSARQADYHAMIQERAGRKQEDEQKDERNQRHRKRSERAGEDTMDTMDILMILPYIAMPPERVKQFWRETKEKKQQMERTRLEDKVVGWRKDVIDAFP